MSDPTLIFLSQIRNNLEAASFDLINASIADLRDKFVPIAILKKGHYIDRVRLNGNGEIFSSKDQISYIIDQDILNSKVDFGRANLQKQAVFYGAIESPQVRKPRLTAWLETTEIFQRGMQVPDNIVEIFTLGRWRILEDIQIIEIIFSDEALKRSEYAKQSFDTQIKGIEDHARVQHLLDQGRFFSNEFSRDDCFKQPFNYKISSSYANYIWNSTHIKGITYPSVKTEFQGQNVALLPELVDSYLHLEIAGMFKFERKDAVNLPIDSIKLARELGEDQKSFKWEDYIGAEQLP